MKTKKFLLYADGGSRGNPGPAGIGAILFDERGRKLKEVYRYIGEATNNVAEYTALICGLEEARALEADEVIVHLDSELVAKQLSGEYRVKSAEIKQLFERAVCLLNAIGSFKIKRIGREKNKDADRLVNKAINLAFAGRAFAPAP